MRNVMVGMLLLGLSGMAAAQTAAPTIVAEPTLGGSYCRMMCDHGCGYGLPLDRWLAETPMKRAVGCDTLYLYSMLSEGRQNGIASKVGLTPDAYVERILQTVESNRMSFFVVYSHPSLGQEEAARMNAAVRADAERFSKWPGFRGFCLDEPAARPLYSESFLAEFKAWLLARYAPAQLRELGLGALTNTATLIVSPATTLDVKDHAALKDLYGRYRKALVDRELAGGKDIGDAFSGEALRKWAMESFDMEQLHAMNLDVLSRSDTVLIVPAAPEQKQEVKEDLVETLLTELSPAEPVRKEKPAPLPPGIILPVTYAANPVLHMEYEEFLNERFVGLLAGMDSALREVKPDGVFFPVFSFMSLLHTPLRSSLAQGGRVCGAVSVDWYADGAQDEAFWAKLMRNQARGPSFLTVTAGKYNSGPAAYARDLVNGLVHSPGINIWAWCYAAPKAPNYDGNMVDFYRPGNYAVMERVFDRIGRLKPYLAPSASTARMALVYSERESMWTQGGKVAWPSWGGFVGNCYGLHVALAQLGLAYEPVFEELITRQELDRYDVVIIPGVTYLRPETVAALEGWVAAGGGLIAMGPVGTKDRWGRRAEASSIAGLTGVVCRPIAEHGGFRLQGGAITGYGRDLVASALELTGAQAMGHWTNGAVAVAIHPAGKGTVVSVGAERLGWSYNPVGRVRLGSYNIPRARRFFSGVLGTLRAIVGAAANGRDEEWLLQGVRSSPDVEVTVRSQPGRTVVHLINYGAVTNAQVNLRWPTAMGESMTAFYPTDMSRATMAIKGRDVQVRVREFDVHETVVIQHGGPEPALSKPRPGPAILPAPALVQAGSPVTAAPVIAVVPPGPGGETPVLEPEW